MARTRMPVFLDRADIKSWLTGAPAMELLKPAAEDRLRMWPISRRINRTGGGDDAALIAEITT
jgi:putative SOS response-associated peptidase YedK